MFLFVYNSFSSPVEGFVHRVRVSIARAVIEGARASSAGGPAVFANKLGKQTGLGLVPGPKREEKQQRAEENTSKERLGSRRDDVIWKT